MSDELVLTTASLDLQDLVCFRYSSGRSKEEDPMYSDHALIIKRSRHLLQLSSKLLVCPRTRDRSVLVVSWGMCQIDVIFIQVCSSNLSSSAQLATACDRLKLDRVTRRRLPLSPSMLEECFVFTLKARLAPLWIQVIQSLFFLSNLCFRQVTGCWLGVTSWSRQTRSLP